MRESLRNTARSLWDEYGVFAKFALVDFVLLTILLLTIGVKTTLIALAIAYPLSGLMILAYWWYTSTWSERHK